MSMRTALDGFYDFLDRPLFLWARPVVVVLAVVMAASLAQPLWRIHMVAPQYPRGLDLHVHAYKLEGGNGGQDIKEINTLNHYIGMRPISREALRDLDWIPFAFGLLVLLALRVALIGNVRALFDLVVLTTYVGLFALGRFWYQLWSFGHELDPAAPFKIEPFTPVMLGRKTIANFETEAGPMPGTFLVTAFATGIALLLLVHLVVGRRQAVRARRVRPA